jgi:hypothetical protein
LQSQLISQATIQSLAAQLGADASLVKTLLTNTAVLSDPSQAAAPPVPLLEGFIAAADIGLSVTYFSGSLEESATAVGSATLATANTDQATNPAKPTSVNSGHFEGYLEVPADGPYQFTAILPNNTTSVSLQFDFMSTPLTLIAGASTGNPATFPYSGYTQFKAGIPYHFTLDFQNLAGGNAKLLVQGEALPQGPLGQLTLYPEVSVQRFNRSQILLAKTLQLIRGFNLDENEAVYLVTHPGDFGNISFNALPTQAADYSPANAQKLFGQFLRLASYAALKEGPAGGTDGLIDVFQNARQTIPVAPLPAGVTSPIQLAGNNLYQTIGNLTRRDVPTIQSVILQLWGAGAIQTVTTSTQLQFTCAPLVNEIGFARLWEALQMVQTLGVQPQVLKQTTGIVYPSRATTNPDPGFAIASALRNAVKSQYTPDQWRPVAQSVFDPLRQKKRDALCAYVLNLQAIEQFGATDTNGLFEYFLVDPGMEPVVQTSRIRLALSSVQTFIQRCLLNLEPNVKPSIIDSDRWDWMKRYRVWEANREIFLWPENWLIPEFRENATDLFQALQGTLLQGNITQDLVAQAYTQYLQDLDARARLDIVSMFNQAPPLGDPSSSYTLHVIGRHHGKPMKYFYRTFSNGIWTGWIPVTPDIEGDHVVAVIWRGRLTIFWLTFAVQGVAAPTSAAAQTNSDNTTPASKLTDLSFSDLSSIVVTAKPPKTVQIQLNWSEYYQGKWTPRKSSDINRFAPYPVSDDFDPASSVYVRASIDTDENGDETAVRIHMEGVEYITRAFRLTSKNSEPVCEPYYWQEASTAFQQLGTDATKYVGYNADASNPVGSNIFQTSYSQALSMIDGTVQSEQGFVEPVLQSVNSYNLLVCDNPPLAPPDNASLYSSFMSQIGILSSPFFYEDTSDYNTDKELTFFVQPTLTEKSVSQWEEWAIGPLFPSSSINDPKYWNAITLTAQVAATYQPPSPDPEVIFQYQPNADWVTNESTRISYRTSVIGSQGRTLTGGTFSGIKTSGVLPKTALLAGSGTTGGGGAKIISSSGLDFATALALSRKA